ncbi:hypothetical protein BDY17DRAFT_329340 [Neohortaea acidophila]|uniref:Uncharacterized protein n=1 Tax=Neohortaea acidophila TaxID=245834 RepID=A0A6A6Q6J3_9PEZI|nr:uncharacterized protein BDY17DRAFT_329340 [Neohortaea acidophila]KAF2487691.1 hypothetical protein BDY17DRAFT_329340 [Neohortaea acidophila]
MKCLRSAWRTRHSKEKIKCDGTRPECRGEGIRSIVCEGYSILDMRIREAHPVVECAQSALAPLQRSRAAVECRLGDPITGQEAYRTQLLAVFLQDRSPKKASIAPYISHMRNASLPHLCATYALSMPLLRYAVDTLSLAHLASKLNEPWIIHAASDYRGRLICKLRDAVQSHRPAPRQKQLRGGAETGCSSPSPQQHAANSNAQSILMTILLMSIMPPFAEDSDAVRREQAAHLEAMAPSFLTGYEHLDTVIIRQLQYQQTSLSITRRKTLEFLNPEWTKIPRMLFEEENAMYRKSGWVAKASAASRWHQPTADQPRPLDRQLIRDFTLPLPKWLQTADRFCEGSGRHSRTALDAISASVRRAHEIWVTAIHPATLDAPRATLHPMVTRRDVHLFDPNIEEHAYMLENPTVITEHYRFTAGMYTIPSANVRFTSLLSDCAILKVIYSGMERDRLGPNWTGISKDTVERRARVTAVELCQHVHYIAYRPLTAAKFSQALVTGAREFFECAGLEAEAQWREGCLAAISARIHRLSTQPGGASLCPLINEYELACEGFRYK